MELKLPDDERIAQLKEKHPRFTGNFTHLHNIALVLEAESYQRAFAVGEWNDWMSYSRERVELRGADFDRADFSQMNFRCANLHSVSAIGANFSRCILRSTILRSAKLAGSNFNEAIMNYCDLIAADIEECCFSEEQELFLFTKSEEKETN